MNSGEYNAIFLGYVPPDAAPARGINAFTSSMESSLRFRCLALALTLGAAVSLPSAADLRGR